MGQNGVVFAQVAPGNAASLRAFLRAGFDPIGSEALFLRRLIDSAETVYALEVLAHFAAQGYGDFEWLDHRRWIRRPDLLAVSG